MKPEEQSARLNRCAVLIGMSHYRDSRFIAVPAAANSLRRMQEILTDPSLCGWSPEQVTVIDNPADGRHVAVQIRKLAERTDGLFLFYFVGHGTLSEEGTVFLPLAETDAEHVDLTALPFAHVRTALLSSPAQVKISILDCCYSGRAIQTLSAESTDLSLAADVHGTYTWAAADDAAHVVPLAEQGGVCTSFTGELIELVREGIPDGPRFLTLGDLYEPMRQRLRARGLPLPSRRIHDSASSTPFTRNAAIPTAATPHRLPAENGVGRSSPPPFDLESRPSIARRDTKALKAAMPIHRVIGTYIPLRGGGRELRGACPFCATDDGYFRVNSEKSVYHCFKCQAGGDTLNFLMQMEHLTFGEAVDRLASLAGITLSEDGGHHDRQHVERIRMIEAHKAAADFYTTRLNTLPEAGIGRTFLADRGFDKAAAAHFGVGYSPQGWDHLVRHLRKHGFTDKELHHSGLIVEGRRGPIDRFRGRLMWPIRNIGGEVVGFGARKLHDADNGPKYIYTPETAIYKKSQALFGIDLAKRDIASSLRVFLVEDFTDVMASHLAGVTTAVATCGTLFSGGHAKLLRRLLPDDGLARAVFAFEDIESGQQAALRAITDDSQFIGQMYIAITPDNLSPSALRIAKGNQAVADLAQPRTPLHEFALTQITLRHDLETPTSRAAALDEAAPLVASIRNSAWRREIAIQLAGMLNIQDAAFVVSRVAQLARTDRRDSDPAGNSGQRRQDGTEPTLAVDLRNPIAKTERELLKLSLQRPELVSPAFDAYGVDEFTARAYAIIRQAILDAGGAEYGVQEQSQYLHLIREAAPNHAARALITELCGETIMSKTVNETYAGNILVAVRRRSVARRIQELLGALAVTSSTDSPAHLTHMQNELWTLYKYDQALRELGAKAL